MTTNRTAASALPWVIGSLLAALMLTSSVAQTTTVPPDLRASLLLRTLAYDRKLSERTSDSQVTILIVEGPDREDTEAVAVALESATARVSVAGMPVRVARHRFGGVDSLMAAIERESATVVYLGAGLEAHAGSIASTAAAQQATLVAADGADMPNGCSLGFTVDGSRPVIVIDVARAAAAGMDFDPSVLQVARVL